MRGCGEQGGRGHGFWHVVNAQLTDKVLHKKQRMLSDIRTSLADGQGPFTFLHTSERSYPSAASEAAGSFQHRRRDATGAKGPEKQRGRGWGLGHLPGLLHLLDKCIRPLSHVRLCISHTLVGPSTLGQETPPTDHSQVGVLGLHQVSSSQHH